MKIKTIITLIFAFTTFCFGCNSDILSPDSSSDTEHNIEFTDRVITDSRHLGDNETKFNIGDNILVRVKMKTYIDEADGTQRVDTSIYQDRCVFQKMSDGYFSRVTFDRQNGVWSEKLLPWLPQIEQRLFCMYPSDIQYMDINDPYLQNRILISSTNDTANYETESGKFVTVGTKLYNSYTTETVEGKEVYTGENLSKFDKLDFMTANAQDLMYSATKPQLVFGHRLSRLHILIISGTNNKVQVLGVAIYPQKTAEIYNVKYGIGNWENSGNYELPDSFNTEAEVSENFDNAPIKYELTTPYTITSKAEVIRDSLDGEDFCRIFETWMVPECKIKHILLKIRIFSNESEYIDSYMSVTKQTINENDCKTREGHVTSLILTFKATMITLLKVYVKDWTELPGVSYTGDIIM